MTKLQRAKQQARKKWREILQELPELSNGGFYGRLECGNDCGFCLEYRKSKLHYPYTCRDCPALDACRELQVRWEKICDKDDWRKFAKSLCRWVLRKIGKVRESA